MTAGAAADAPTIAVVGGGLAGLAAAAALGTSGCRVKLFEARRMLGGRAASFRDPASGELVDHCQHVGMGCCTNLADFCRRTEIGELFRRDRTLWFIDPEGRQYRFGAVRWLPAPLHLAPGFWRLTFLSRGDRLGIARALWKLMRTCPADDPRGPTIGAWLAANGQSATAIEQFWRVILVSALGESLDRASLFAARKVLVDGFLAAREAYTLDIPEAPLAAVYGQRLARWLAEHGIEVNLGAAVRRVSCDQRPILQLADGQSLDADFVVVAVPWPKVAEVLDPRVVASWPWLDELTRMESAPITGVHLWFDRPIMPLAHAVLVGRTSQWIFNRGCRQPADGPQGHYYQVVISASRELAGRDRDAIAALVRDELAAIWPEVVASRLLRARVVTEHGAVFSPRPGLESLRPAQATSLERLFLAGDWTATGWPATMESAVRSGYLAAEGILKSLGRPRAFLASDLKRGALARLLIR
jgi:squalene-associated FAD-dependent desaturase